MSMYKQCVEWWKLKRGVLSRTLILWQCHTFLSLFYRLGKLLRIPSYLTIFFFIMNCFRGDSGMTLEKLQGWVSGSMCTLDEDLGLLHLSEAWTLPGPSVPCMWTNSTCRNWDSSGAFWVCLQPGQQAKAQWFSASQGGKQGFDSAALQGTYLMDDGWWWTRILL